jgi:hypothetical protein
MPGALLVFLRRRRGAIFRLLWARKSRMRTWISLSRYHLVFIDANHFVLRDTVNCAKPVQNRV